MTFQDWSHHAPDGVSAQLYESLTSTNLVAKEGVKKGWSGKPQWLLAKYQTAARGRLGRSWSSEGGNFAGSLTIGAAPFEKDLSTLPLAIGLAVRETVCSYIADPRRVEVKWPNDVLIDTAKVSGILIEREDGPMGPALIIGIGVNLVFAPKGTDYKAASLKSSGGSTPALVSFFENLSRQVQSALSKLRAGSRLDILKSWRDVAFGMGTIRPVTIEGKKQPATLLRLNDDASLSVRLDDGREIRLYAGDIG